MATNVLLVPDNKYYTPATTPWYFGAWLHQARHNLAVTLNDLSKKLGSEVVADDSNLLHTKAITILTDTQAKPDEVQKAMAYYEKHLPFLFGMHFRFSGEDHGENKKLHNLSACPVGYAIILQQLIQVLQDARNYYLHYTGINEPIVVPKLLHWLNDAFDINIRVIKRRFNLHDSELNHLRRFVSNRDKRLTDKTGKPLQVIPNPAFKYYFNRKDKKTSFSEYGLAFFTCLLLPTTEAWLYLKKINGFKSANTRSYKASLDAFCVNNIQLPKERFATDNSMRRLVFDMCNELTLAPQELFETLHPDKQKLFIIKEQEYSPDPTGSEYPGMEINQIRKKNRFTYFAQRYLDITHAFQNLRFGVDLGDYHYSIYPKTIGDIHEMRRLTRHLIGYGRLEDFVKDKRPADYQALYINPNDQNIANTTQPYIAEMGPHYHVENNLIPINFINEDVFWPSLQTQPTYGQKSYPNRYIKDNANQKKPVAWLSVHELPALLFYELIQQDVSARQIIMDHITNIHNFFLEIKAGTVQPVSPTLIAKPSATDIMNRSNPAYNQRWKLLMDLLHKHALQPAYIPEKIVNFLLGIAPANTTDVHEKAAARLQQMIIECRNFIEQLEQREQEDNKPGKKNFRKIKVSKLADILAADMMLMQSSLNDSKGDKIPASKPNSTAFSVLQSHLAYFDKHKNKLPGIFKACHLTDAPNAHPFLHNIPVMQYKNIIDFYKAYFNEKITFLENCQQERKYADYYFLKIKQSPTDIMNLVDVYLNNNGSSSYSACNLPRGLFHEAAMRYFKEKGSPVMKDYVKQYEGAGNTIHLINYYFNRELNDTSQNFYSWPRQYELFNQSFDKEGAGSYFTMEERTQKWEAAKYNTIRDKNTLAQKRSEAEKDILALKKELSAYRDAKPITRFALTKYGEKYPAIKKIQFIRFKESDIPRKIIGKIIAFIEESVKEVELKAKAYTFCKENEQYLRLVETQDKLLFMCIQRMFANNPRELPFNKSNAFRLQTITAPNDPAADKSIINCTTANGIHCTRSYHTVNNKEATITIVDTDGKIKSSSTALKLIKDRRLNNLCFYFQPDKAGKIIFNSDLLEREFRQYEKQRFTVLEKMAELEKALYEKHSISIQQHQSSLAFYIAHYDNTYETIQPVLNAIRHSFLINQYPAIHDEQLMLSAEAWNTINDNYQPFATNKGYGIIGKITTMTIHQYTLMISQIGAANCLNNDER